ncbi:MAG: hypothetical protein JSV80_07505 [Acidobacteriota bacterium]|nr:MAG: hypothetical protein JSV80_07505 [Acidobacteriota bacterium]
MKKVFILAAVLVMAVVGFNYMTTGELTLMPASSLSDEERQLNDLRDEFADAQRQVASASRSAGLSGLDTTVDVQDAISIAKRIEESLKRLTPRLTSESAKARAARLAQDIREFRRQYR